MADVSVIFHHDLISPDLTVVTGADQISWGYGLNHVTYPTYGGEVVQILSAYIDDLAIQGTCRTYRELDGIYQWFLNYFQFATQGRTHNGNGPPQYVETPIIFRFPDRGWELKIKVTDLPGWKIGRDVVAPQWQIKARVVEEDPHMRRLTLDAAAHGLDDFGRLKGDIGFTENNPFSNPFPDKTKFDPAMTREAFQRIGDYFTSLVSSYRQGDLSSLGLEGSGPAFLNPGNSGPTPSQQVKVPNKN